MSTDVGNDRADDECGFVGRHDETVMRERSELVVTVVDGQDRGTDTSCVRDTFEQLLGCCIRRDDEHRLVRPAASSRANVTDRCGGASAGGAQRTQSRRQLRDAGEARLVVEMRGEVPRLLGGRPDEQQAAGSRARPAQGRGERTGAIDPPAGPQQLTQRVHTVGVHAPMLPVEEVSPAAATRAGVSGRRAPRRDRSGRPRRRRTPGRRSARAVRRSAYCFTNRGIGPARSPAMSCQTSTCPSQSTPAPMPIVGIGELGRDPLGDVGGDHLQHDGERSGLLQRERVEHHPVAGVTPPLHPVAAEPVLALRGEPEVRHHRDARRDQRARPAVRPERRPRA